MAAALFSNWLKRVAALRRFAFLQGGVLTDCNRCAACRPRFCRTRASQINASIPLGCHVPSQRSSVVAHPSFPVVPNKSSSVSPLCRGGGDSANNSPGTLFCDVGVQPVWSELRNLSEVGDVKVASVGAADTVFAGELGAGSTSAVTTAVPSTLPISVAGKAAANAFSSFAAPSEPTAAS